MDGVTVNQEGGDPGGRLGGEPELGLLGVKCLWDTLLALSPRLESRMPRAEERGPGWTQEFGSSECIGSSGSPGSGWDYRRVWGEKE